MDRILAHETEKAIRDFNAMWMDGKDPATLLTELSGLLRDALMMKVAPKGGQSLITGGYDSATLESLGAHLTKEEFISAMETLQKAQTQIRAGANPRTTAELCLVSLCDNTLGESVSALRARISRLEEQLKNGVAVQTVPVREPARTPAREPIREEVPPPPEEEYPEPAPFMEEIEEPVFDRPVSEPSEEPVHAPEPEPPEPAVPTMSESGKGVSWKEIAAEAAPGLPKDICMRLDDEKSVRAWVEGPILHLEVLPGFLYGRFNKTEVLAKFSEAATRLAGREVRASLSELTEKPETAKRSLEDLKAFKEVRFV